MSEETVPPEGDPGYSFEIVGVGLVVHGLPPIDAYRMKAAGLGQAHECIRWLIGDLLVACEVHHGEQYAQVAADTRLTAKDLMNCKSIALKFPHSRRRERLSWSHHQDVSPLEVPAQDQLLLQAEAEEWSSKDLRRKVREAQGLVLEDPRPEPGCPAGHVPCIACNGMGYLPEPESDGEVFLTYPCNGSVREWVLLTAQVEQWKKLYPGLDIEAECRKALAWVDANTKKTARGMPRFLVNWLNRANDRGGNGGTSGAPAWPFTPTPKESVAEKVARIAARAP